MPTHSTGNNDNVGKGAIPEPHQVSTVAMKMADLLDLAEHDPEAFKQHLKDNWARMRASGGR